LVLVAHHQPVVALATEVSGAGGTSQGATSIEMVGADPRLGDGTKNLLQDLMVHDTGVDVSRSAAPTPKSPGTMGLGLSGPCLLDSPGSSSSPIN
jgi:hypothetical protein